jgi:hypothetical protein
MIVYAPSATLCTGLRRKERGTHPIVRIIIAIRGALRALKR